MLDNIYEHDGIITTAAKHAKLLGIAPKIILWRMSKGYDSDKLFAPVKNPIVYNDQVWEPRMLAEYVNNDEQLLRVRWAAGFRGYDLVKPSRDETSEDAQKRDYETRNREFLRLLLKHNRRRALEVLKGYNRDVFEEPTDTAAAIMNAQRLVAEAQGTGIRTNGTIWEFAA